MPVEALSVPGVLGALRRNASISSHRSDASVACAPRRCTTTALRVWLRSRRTSLLGVTNSACRPNSRSAWMMRAATACELLENASSSTMVPNTGRLAPLGHSA